MKLKIFIAFVLGFLVGVASMVDVNKKEPTVTQPQNLQSVDTQEVAPSTESSKIKTSFGDGIFRVGVDIEPGTYKSESDYCYWARLSSFTGDDNIIANEIGEGQMVVTIKNTDVGFKSNGCGGWEKIN